MISQEEIALLLPALESDRIEKTVSKTNSDKFGEAICAFCNDMPGHGLPGYLIIGANDDGSLNGTKVDEQLMQTLLNFRTDGRIVPPPAMTVTKFSFEDGDIAVVEVQPSKVPPARYKGRVCVRVGQRRGLAILTLNTGLRAT
ncbi:ATP-binding protein [Dyadobacter sp. 676]|uniref:ATP-binding protein n=1 Tax=Dyadobacter sp. 676 TaxID=3088362 RepID=A0AAU8FJE1_9BACT